MNYNLCEDALKDLVLARLEVGNEFNHIAK